MDTCKLRSGQYAWLITIMLGHYSSVFSSVDLNCNADHNLSLSLSTIFNGTILDHGTVSNPHYQFRVDLSRADHCHCLTVDSATGVIGNIIFNQWRDGSFWCGSNITQLCASSIKNTTFYSALISVQNGSLLNDDGSLLCDNSTDANPTISDAGFPVVQLNCSSSLFQGMFI